MVASRVLPTVARRAMQRASAGHAVLPGSPPRNAAFSCMVNGRSTRGRRTIFRRRQREKGCFTDEGSVQNACVVVRQVRRHQAGYRGDPAGCHSHQDPAAHRLADSGGDRAEPRDIWRVRPSAGSGQAPPPGELMPDFDHCEPTFYRTRSMRSTRTTTCPASLTTNRRGHRRRRLRWSSNCR